MPIEGYLSCCDLLSPVGWVERIPQKPAKSQKNTTCPRYATPNRKRVKPNVWVPDAGMKLGFAAFFGEYDHNSDFTRIWNTDTPFSVPLYPTYGTDSFQKSYHKNQKNHRNHSSDLRAREYHGKSLNGNLWCSRKPNLFSTQFA